MDKAQSEHLARVHHLRESFVEANERLVARLRRVSDEAAERGADGAWSAAQIGWHVAKVTTRFAAMIAGDVGGPQPLPGGFRVRPWAEVAAALRPAGRAARRCGSRARSVGDEDRGGHMGVTHAIVGTISVYENGRRRTSCAIIVRPSACSARVD
jgi:hypothetical protein